MESRSTALSEARKMEGSEIDVESQRKSRYSSEQLSESSSPLKSNARIYWTTVIVTLSLLLSVAMVVVGERYLGRCQAEKYVPVYLIVLGSTSIVLAFVIMAVELFRRRVRKDGSSFYWHFSFLMAADILGVFLIVWFIAGNVWVFRIRHRLDTSYADDPMYCQKNLYEFAFWFNIIIYIIIVIPVLIRVALISCLGMIDLSLFWWIRK